MPETAPMSISVTRSSVTMMLSGFRSLYTTPRECK